MFNQSITQLIVSGLMGVIGGFVTVPFSAFVNWRFKRKEIELNHKLDMINTKRELLLQFELERKRMTTSNSEVEKIKQQLEEIQTKIS